MASISSGPEPKSVEQPAAPPHAPPKTGTELQTIFSKVLQLEKGRFAGVPISEERLKEWQTLQRDVSKLSGKQAEQETHLEKVSQIIQSALSLENLILEAKKDLAKVEKWNREIEKVMGQMKGSPEELRREKGRRLMDPVMTLIVLKNRILSEDPSQVYKYPELVESLKKIETHLDQMAPATIEQARFFCGLHLDGHTPVGFENVASSKVILFSHLRDQNLEAGTTQKVANASHTVINAYTQSTRQAYGHHLFIPLEDTLTPRLAGVKQPTTVVGRVNKGGSVEVQQIIEKRVATYIDTSDYTSLYTLTDFIDFVEMLKITDPDIDKNPMKAYRRFDPGPESVRYYSDHCTGRAKAILKILQDEFQITGYLVVEKRGPTAFPQHTAAVIPCKDGLVLVEVGSDFPVVVVKPNQHAKIIEHEGEREVPMTFEIQTAQDGTSTLYKTAARASRDGRVRLDKTQFPLTDLPIKPVMLKYMMDTVEFPIVNERAATIIKVNIHEGLIVFQKGFGRDAKRSSFAFADFEKPEVQAELIEYCKHLNTPKEVLEGLIRKVIKHQALLNKLQAQAHTPVPTYPTK